MRVNRCVCCVSNNNGKVKANTIRINNAQNLKYYIRWKLLCRISISLHGSRSAFAFLSIVTVCHCCWHWFFLLLLLLVCLRRKWKIAKKKHIQPKRNSFHSIRFSFSWLLLLSRKRKSVPRCLLQSYNRNLFIAFSFGEFFFFGHWVGGIMLATRGKSIRWLFCMFWWAQTPIRSIRWVNRWLNIALTHSWKINRVCRDRNGKQTEACVCSMSKRNQYNIEETCFLWKKKSQIFYLNLFYIFFNTWPFSSSPCQCWIFIFVWMPLSERTQTFSKRFERVPFKYRRVSTP